MFNLFIRRVPETNFLDWFNPLAYLSDNTYASLWKGILDTFLTGFWSRFFATACLVLAFWFGAAKQRIPTAILFFGLTIVFTYLGGLGKIAFWWLF